MLVDTVLVPNVVEEMDLVLVQIQRRKDGMYRRISPSLVEKSAIVI